MVSRDVIWIAAAVAFANQAAAQSPASAPTAVVTFYSGGHLFKNLLPVTKSETFSGCIFDGPAMLGCITYRGFVTVHMTAGLHVLSASLSSRHPAKNSQLELTLEAGKNYFLSAAEENNSFQDVIGRTKGRLDVVSCEVAHKETSKSQPMEEKQLGPLYKGLSLPDMPQCAGAP